MREVCCGLSQDVYLNQAPYPFPSPSTPHYDISSGCGAEFVQKGQAPPKGQDKEKDGCVGGEGRCAVYVGVIGDEWMDGCGKREEGEGGGWMNK